jgi:hypothetical protein
MRPATLEEEIRTGRWLEHQTCAGRGGRNRRSASFVVAGVSTFRAVGLGKMVAQALACEARDFSPAVGARLRVIRKLSGR